MTNSSFKFLFLLGFLSTVTYSFSQYTLSGKLTDDNGEALIGATVKIASLSWNKYRYGRKLHDFKYC